MQKTILSLFVLIAVIFTFSCNTAVEPSSKSSSKVAAITTQKVILLYGNYSLVNNDKDIKLTNAGKSILLPVSLLLDGKALFGDNQTNKFQGSLLFKDEGTTYAKINALLKASISTSYSANKLDPTGSQGIVIPKTPPPCGPGQCPGIEMFQMSTFEINVAVPINIEATIL